MTIAQLSERLLPSFPSLSAVVEEVSSFDVNSSFHTSQVNLSPSASVRKNQLGKVTFGWDVGDVGDDRPRRASGQNSAPQLCLSVSLPAGCNETVSHPPKSQRWKLKPPR